MLSEVVYLVQGMAAPDDEAGEARRRSASDADALEGMPKEGDVIAGKFRVERVLATGGMGVVFAALHLTLGQRVAVKMLLPDAMVVPSAVERFQREAQAAANIQNEHVVRIMDVGSTDKGSPYMVMEYLVGCDLGDLIESRKTVPPQEAVDYLLQACEAMAEAHRIGIVHRDLKPGNVFLTKRSDNTPLVKVLDFGISKLGDELMGREQGSLTATHVMMGSPLYMSPEQIRSAKTVDRRTDIWSMGVILFELLTGQLPFEGETAIAICAQVAADPPIPLRLLMPELSVELEEIILRCLEKEPERRYDDVAELSAALAPHGSDAGRASAERVRKSVADPSQLPTLHAARIKLDLPKSQPKALAKTDASWHKVAEKAAPPKKRGRGFIALLFIGLMGFGAWKMRAELLSAARTSLGPDPAAADAAPGPIAAAPDANPTLAFAGVTAPDATPAPETPPATTVDPLDAGADADADADDEDEEDDEDDAAAPEAGTGPRVATSHPRPKRVTTGKPGTKPGTKKKPRKR
jgi:serine/threonine protein kinase